MVYNPCPGPPQEACLPIIGWAVGSSDGAIAVPRVANRQARWAGRSVTRAERSDSASRRIPSAVEIAGR